MHEIWNTGRIPQISLLVVAAFALNGCLMDETADERSESGVIDTQLTGSVGDGPLAGAAMRVLSADGQLLAEFESDLSAGYSINVKSRATDYPLVVDAWSGIDLVTGLAPEFALRASTVKPGSKAVVNVNPYSTLAVEVALDLEGGLTADNVLNGHDIVIAALNHGMTTLLADGPMFTPIDGSNLAEIVKASESLGEVVRRTRDWQSGFGFSVDADRVMQRLGSDLVDGVVDGRGGPRSNARTAAVATIVTAQILLESMSNELHVNGVNAAAAMDAVIRQVNGGPVQRDLASLTSTAAMVTQVEIGLTAAAAVSTDPALEQLRVAVAGLAAGMSPAQVKSRLPADYRQTLDNVLSIVAGGNSTTLSSVNQVARDGSTDPGVNRAPTISGSPPAQVGVSQAYSFTPAAADADGDTLTFSISNKPGWASFNTSTGRLSGTPTSSHAGNYANIGISVSDGQESASLAPFSITVAAGAPVNTPPTISGTPASEVGMGQAYSFTPNASDADGDALTFSISNKPAWASFNNTTGRLSGTPTSGNPGTHGNISITVSDGVDSASLGPFSITVTAAVPGNSPPAISGTPPSIVTADTAYSFTPSASDPDGDSLSFSVSGLPSWASFNTSNGRLNGTPGSGDVGTYSNIRITVSDGSASATLGPFAITVEAISLGSATLSWLPPTQNDDGTPLTDLAGYRIYWGKSAGNYPNSATINNAGLTTYVIENLAPGTYEFVATAFNSAGMESAYSGAATKTVQ